MCRRNEVRTLRPDDGAVRGRNGRMAGDFHGPTLRRIDSRGTIFTTKVDTGKWVQTFPVQGSMVLRKRTP